MLIEHDSFNLERIFNPLQMEDTIRQRVVGQDHVVKAISDAVRISRAGLQAPNRPVASFLFLGPTGVGKVCNKFLSSRNLRLI